MAPRYNYDRVQYVDPHPGQDDSAVLWTSKCPRCGGSGEFREFDHIEDGVCFECRGDKSYRFHYTVEMARKQAKSDVRRQNKIRLNAAKTEKFVAEAVATRSEWALITGDHEILVRGWGNEYVWDENPLYNVFVHQLWERMHGFGKFDPKPLSEKQIQAGADAIKRYTERKENAKAREAAKADVPAVVAGKQPIAGVVYGAKAVDGMYGTTYKFGIRQVNGQTYWGTIPKKLMDLEVLETGDWEKKLNGTNVVVEADVSPAKEDHTHGFYKRPKLISADLLNS